MHLVQPIQARDGRRASLPLNVSGLPKPRCSMRLRRSGRADATAAGSTKLVRLSVELLHRLADVRPPATPARQPRAASFAATAPQSVRYVSHKEQSRSH